MRTKTLLLTAAAVAAGLASSSAQSNVYSVNIVGYINSQMEAAGKYTLVGNSFDNGTNSLVSLVDATLPNKSQVLTWTGAGYATSTKGTAGWTANPTIAPGLGFFVKTPPTSGLLTNTFLGSIGLSNNIALPASLTLVCGLPFAGDLTTSTNIALGTILPNKSQILTWNRTTQVFVTSTKGTAGWTTPQVVNAGDGFFVKASSATNWIQIVP